MTVRSGPIKEMGVIVDTTTHVPEGVIEAVIQGTMTGARTEVPLPDMRGGVTSRSEQVGQCDFLFGQAFTCERVQTIRRFIRRTGSIIGHACKPGISPRQQ